MTGYAHRFTTFPAGTMIVNLAGCLLLGVVAGVSVERASLTPNMRLLLVAGVCGGFTTFSAFSYESLALLRGGGAGRLLLSAGGQIIGGLLAVWAGVALGRTI